MSPDKFNQWRVIPRILVALYGLYCFHVGDWYMALEIPTTEQTAFATVIWGAAAAWFKFYVSTGNKRGLDIE